MYISAAILNLKQNSNTKGYFKFKCLWRQFCAFFAVVEMKLFQGKNTINRRQVHICLSANLYIFSLQLLWRQTQQNKLVLFFYPAIIINFMDTIGTFPRWKCCFNGDIQQENPTVTARGSVCPPVASSLIYQDSHQESHSWWLCVFETFHLLSHFTDA